MICKDHMKNGYYNNKRELQRYSPYTMHFGTILELLVCLYKIEVDRYANYDGIHKYWKISYIFCMFSFTHIFLLLGG